MKKFVLVLLAMVVLGFTVDSYALDYQGLRLGMSRKEVMEWVGDTSTIHPDELKKWWKVANIAEDKLRPERTMVTISGTQDDPGCVEKIAVYIDHKRVTDYQQAVYEKYGKPTSSEQTSYQNNFGVKMTGLIEHWKIGTDHIFFMVRPISVGKFEATLIFETDKWVKYELEKSPKPKL